MKQYTVSFKEAIYKAIIENYGNLSGRSSRSEYWWYALFTLILGIVISFVFFYASYKINLIVECIINIILFIPGFGLCIRRLHDINKGGYCFLIILIPIFGVITLIIWFLDPSYHKENRYGPIPNLKDSSCSK